MSVMCPGSAIAIFLFFYRTGLGCCSCGAHALRTCREAFIAGEWGVRAQVVSKT